MLITAVRSVQRNKLVAYLLGKLSSEDLAQRDNLGRTALHEAADVGNLEAAKMLVKQNSSLPYIEDENGQTPLLYAAKTGNREMVRFLLDCVEGSGVVETGRGPPALLYHLANSGLYDAPAKLRNNATKNPAVNENRQNPPAVTDIENPDENPQSGANNPVVNENQQNPLAVTEKSIANEDVQNVAPVKLKNTATENPTEHRRGNTENSANRENPVENKQSPVDTENLANTENPVENLQNYTENPANRENSNHESPQNLSQNLVVSENSHNDAVNPFVDENQQNLPAITENSVVDENPQNVAVNPIVNENRQNPLAIADNSMVNENLRNPPAVTDTENSVVAKDPQNVAVNSVVNENRQNPLAITDNSMVNENLQNATVNPVVNENQQNPPAVTDTENSVVDENPQYGAVTENPPIIENNLQNPVNIADSENPQNCTITENPIVNENPQIINENSQNLIVTDNSIVNENLQIHNDITEDSVVNENPQNPTVYETPHNDIDSTQNPVNNDNLGNRSDLVVDGIGRWHAIHWHLADQFVPAIKHIREMYRKKNKHIKHHEALELVKCLCKVIAKLDFSTATWIFTPALAQATSSGIHEIVEEILRSFPAAISFKNENNQSIFQSAIVWRRENVFNLIYQLKECSHKFLSEPDRFGNNALHLAGCLGPQQHLSVRVSAAGAALQMQRELQWFKEVEKFVLPQDKECRNNDGMTPAEVFTKTHKELVEAGERWMKDTATSCTIVAALIATVMFAAAITVPGGNNASSGVSIFSKQKAFVIFGLSDALALFTSIASLLMFLSILTARYAEEDFLYSLPNRLIIGLVNLFLSISSTMTAFGATLYLMLGENRRWILYPIVAFACIPVHLFGSLLFPLLLVMHKSTHRPAIFGKQSNHMIF
ncbi:Ankyrin repeat-containing protein ITN1 [Camellia lanceoleosa]|uniref:Ankyrin repeat-containing protein ITN1 n=1 Tax=Camellia lanceoleosa TaxID=1840588 RepID=A0ACC0J6P6_9ERIC|nr:Ankyrin repeat-containing protein ITN1 [Camellia lanceoleosa]